MNERDIFTAALDIDNPQERAAFLEGECGTDVALRQQIEELLAAQEKLGSFLAVPVVAPNATGIYGGAAAPVREQAGAVIAGRLKLLEEIGEGGMGTVWMAQQTEPLKRLVAVKLIKAGMDSKQVLARFEAERQALALMDHPNIARVLDAGTTDAGRPYFVMDLVRGVPITKYCDEHHLTPRQRLELFIPVCQAIQHAHQKGIVHRDLKPSNVLVAPYDGKPIVKVIDFGVAKAAGQQLTDRTLVTGFGAIVGTLEYMSPEQAELNNQDIDTRSDIYSLGVLLYELLTGAPPFSRTELEKAGMMEMLRVIREQEPSKPSTKLSTAEGLPALAANRGTEPAKLTKLVRGEPDWIVMKALEKDRSRRYETANGFAMDVERYLADEPVLACPPSTRYRLRKFLRRNKGAMTITAAFAGLLILGTAVSLAFALWARSAEQTAQKLFLTEADARREADKAKEEARDEAEKAKTATATATAVNDFIQRDLLNQLDYYAYDRFPEPPGELKLVTVLARAAQRLEGRFPQQPLVEAALQHTLGSTYASAMHYRAAEPPLRRAVDLRSAHLGQEHLDTLASQAVLAVVTADVELCERTLEAQSRLPGGSQSAAISKLKLALMVRETGNTNRAITLLRETLEEHRRVFGENHRRTAWTMHCLAHTLEGVTGDDDEIERLYRQARTILRKTAGPGNWGTSDNALRLGQFLRSRHRMVEAEAVLRDAFEQLAKLPAVPRNYVAEFARELDELYKGWNEPEKTDEWLRKRAAALRATNAETYRDFGDAFARQGLLDRAETAYREAIRLQADFWANHHNLAEVLRRKKNFADADLEYRAAIRLNPDSTSSHRALGDMLCFETGDYKRALSAIQEAIRLDPNEARQWYVLGSAHAFGAQWRQAAPAYRKAAALDPMSDWCWARFAIAALYTGDTEGYQDACKELLRRFGTSERRELLDLVILVSLLTPDGVNDRKQALELADRTIATTEKEQGYRWHLLSKALAEHRAGRHKESLNQLGQLKADAAGGPLDASAFAVGAMAWHRLGKAKEARAELANAKMIFANSLPDPNDGRAFGDNWHEWVEGLILCGEAERLLK